MIDGSAPAVTYLGTSCVANATHLRSIGTSKWPWSHPFTSCLADALEKSVNNLGWMLCSNFRRFERLHLGQCSLQRKTWEELISRVGAGSDLRHNCFAEPDLLLPTKNAGVPIYRMPYCRICCILFLSLLCSTLSDRVCTSWENNA